MLFLNEFFICSVLILNMIFIYRYAPHKQGLLKALLTQLCLTLCDPVDHSLPSSSVHGILQARILEWIAIPFSRGSSPPKDQTLHCRQIFLPSEPPGRPKTKEYPLFSLELILLNTIRYTVSRCLSTVPETCHDLHPKGTCLAD